MGWQLRLAMMLAGSLGTVATTLFMGLAALGINGSGATPAAAEPTAGYGPSTRAQKDIPPAYLRLYREAAQRYGLDWTILAGIGRVECDHGRDPDPSCTREGAVNSAGAGGPMQFLASTWASYGVDGDGDGRIDRWDPADAIYGAARYLRAAGAPGDYLKAIYAYNHAGWYVAEVERWAAAYRGSPLAAGGGAAGSETAGGGATGGGAAGGGAMGGGAAGGGSGTAANGEDRGGGAANAQGIGGVEGGAGLAAATQTPVQFIAGERAQLSPADGHLALIPAGVPAVVQAMVIAGNELQELPYGSSGHPDPRGALSEDCSSTVNYVLYRSGVRPIAEVLHQNPLAQDYVRWGAPGPGRWVTIYATSAPTDHVFIVIAGLRLDTSHHGTDVGPNRDEDGPRWRILDHIPTWAHWSVRHPPGL